MNCAAWGRRVLALAALAGSLGMGAGVGAQGSSQSPPAAAVTAYRDIHAFDKAERARLDFARSSGKSALEVATMANEALPRRVELDGKLRALRQAGAPRADYFWGVIHLERGAALLGRPHTLKARAAHFADALAAFQQAERRAEPGAAWNLALMHKRGWGVPASRSAAAEWYARAGFLYISSGDLQQASAALASAEEMDVAQPGVAQLRQRLAAGKR